MTPWCTPVTIGTWQQSLCLPPNESQEPHQTINIVFETFQNWKRLLVKNETIKSGLRNRNHHVTWHSIENHTLFPSIFMTGVQPPSPHPKLPMWHKTEVSFESSSRVTSWLPYDLLNITKGSSYCCLKFVKQSNTFILWAIKRFQFLRDVRVFTIKWRYRKFAWSFSIDCLFNL